MTYGPTRRQGSGNVPTHHRANTAIYDCQHDYPLCIESLLTLNVDGRKNAGYFQYGVRPVGQENNRDKSCQNGSDAPEAVFAHGYLFLPFMLR